MSCENRKKNNKIVHDLFQSALLNSEDSLENKKYKKKFL